jgi:heme exporter protein A
MSFHASPDAVVLHDLAVLRHGMPLFRPISGIAAPGTVTWLTGANGSGKSSLLQFLSGARLQATGQMAFPTIATQHTAQDWQRPIASIGHRLGLQPGLTVAEHAALLADDRDLAMAALGELGLAGRANVPIEFLSQGQKQRLAWAIWILSARARIWLLDEAFANLDAAGVAILAAMGKTHIGDGGIIIYTAHQPIPGIGPDAEWQLVAA